MSSGPQRWTVIAVATIGFAVGMLASDRFDSTGPTEAIGFWGSEDEEEEERKAPKVPRSPATVTLPDTGDRYMSLHVINQDHYMFAVTEPGRHKLQRNKPYMDGCPTQLWAMPRFSSTADIPSDIFVP